jgi:crotonobetainyl-CoA:carnitine CoA-transferase CaiB-like acyl-CoA transferase
VGDRDDPLVAFQPLAGIRVLDLTSSLAGPYCTQILSAFGADVVKVERPDGGDETRRWGPPFWGEDGVLFLSTNAGKRSLALDLTHPDGLEALLRLAARSDVVVQSLRPGTAERRGLGYGALRERNPKLVYCSISGYGRTGPLADRAGYDPLLQGETGIMSVTGEPDRAPVRVGVSLIDQGTGVWAALAIVAALYDGGGRELDLSLFETGVSLVPYHVLAYLATGETPGRHGTAFPLIVPYQSFAARDGEFMVATPNDRLFAALLRALDLDEDPRFVTNPERVAHRDEVVALLSARFAEEDVRTWLDRLAEAGVPAAPVNDVAQVAEHAQTRALGLLQPTPHPNAPDLVEVAPPLSVDGERVPHRSPPPRLGEHTAELLAEAGYSPGEVERLFGAGVVTGPAR